MTIPNRKTLPLDLAALHSRLQGEQGVQYWRSLEEIAATPQFQEFVTREFPQQASTWDDKVSRRHFLQLMGASLALAGLGACSTPPQEDIVPYVQAADFSLIPDKPLFFATAMPLGGFGTGVLVENTLGRPTKIEGNPTHPASLGAIDAFTQASLLTLYDPDRSQAITNRGRITTWEAFLGALSTALEPQRLLQGRGIRLLTETLTSPTLAWQIQTWLGQFPEAVWHQYEPVVSDNARAGTQLAFGEDVQAVYHLDKADTLLVLDADILACAPGSLHYARDFAQRRRVQGERKSMNRLYAVESGVTVTGGAADHRLPLASRQIAIFAHALAQALGILTSSPSTSLQDLPYAQWIEAVARDLQAHRSRSLVIAGERQPPVVHALAHAMNQALGNVGHTVVYTAPVIAQPVDQGQSLRTLVTAMAEERVDILIILSGNPVYTAPVDVSFASHLDKVKFRVHLSLYDDETSRLCHWHIPETHYLEAWGDVRAYDGTISLIQPLIAPLYDSKSSADLLAALSLQPTRRGYDMVREYWRQQFQGDHFETFWRTALHDGVIAGTASPPREVRLRPQWFAAMPEAPAPAQGLEINFAPDATIWDGRFANNAWLQELPKPLTKLTWDNAALLSPATAERLGLHNEEMVELHYRGRQIEAPVWIVPGLAEETVSLALGYGRHRAGRVGNGTGFNASLLRTSEAFWFDTGLEIRPLGKHYRLATTQHHHSMEGRSIIVANTLQGYLKQPHFVHDEIHSPEAHDTLYPLYPSKEHAWGMAIDLTACIGCNACVIACQAENNIPTVGKDEVIRGREMHWIRVDRYYKGSLHNPEVYHQPVPCMHCEHAPCEVVCPVAATTHSDEGLNEMTYNRCIGTRYCSNNCPYKVRRFNFFQYADFHTTSLKLLRNPEVTVRSRGVMEKCTYCVQRINAARIQAKVEDRPIRDGEIVTACQAACPTGAIVFGDSNDPASEVSRRKAEPLNYGLLADLNTRPRTTYLAHLRNPNPALLSPETLQTTQRLK